jgi:magnesium chelatase family protein
MDRIDIHIEVTPVPFDKLSDDRRPSSVDIRKELLRLEITSIRFEQMKNIHYNANEYETN